MASASSPAAPNSSSSNSSDLMPAVPQNFWTNRWQLGQIGWHKSEVNNDLRRYSPLFQQHFDASHSPSVTPRRCRILVPLCGKTLDLVHLYQQGYDVIGVEYVEQAIVNFFAEQSKTFSTFERKKFSENMEIFSSADGRLQILRADFFDTQLVKAIGTIDFVWDRAALVAIGHSAETRRKYVSQIYHILQHQFSTSSSNSSPRVSEGILLPHILLEVFCYNQDLEVGPPFSQSDEQIRNLFSNVVEDNEGKGKHFPVAGEKFKELEVTMKDIREISGKQAKKKVYVQLLSDYLDDSRRFHGPAYVRVYSIQFA